MRDGRRCGLFAVLALLVFPGVEARPAPQTSAAGPEEPEVLGAPPAFDLSGEQADHVRVDAGALLHATPAARASVLTRIAAAVDLPVLERRGDWVRVRYESWKGWVRLGASGAEEDPVADDVAAAASPAAAWSVPAGPDPVHLGRVRALLAAERRLTWGSFELFTDVTDGALLAALESVAARLPEAFARRYALALPSASEAVVLYAADEAYRAYAAGQEGLAELDSSGHAVGALAVLAVGERRREEVRSLLVHELTHLLTFRALGPRLPPWLAEGLAEDLAYCRVAASGELEPATLDAWQALRSGTIVTRNRPQSVVVRTRGGPELALAELRERWRARDRPALAELLELSHADFMAPDRRPLHYPMSAFLVRYLLASQERAARFRAFLAAVAGGGEAGGRELLAHLGTDWEELEAGLAEWLFSRGAARPPRESD